MTWRQRWSNKNKYGNTSSTYNGVQYHSKREAREAAELDLRVKAGEILRWERQVRISLDVNGYHICNYFIDFVLYYPDGRTEYLEVKGFETEVWRLKWKLFESLYGDDPMKRLTVVK